MAENKVRFGLSNVAVAFKKDEGYEKPIKIPGAVTLTKDAEGDQNIFYADNVAYYTTNSNAGYTGELTMALIPDEIKARMLGWKIDKYGALVEIADGTPETFALLYRIEGDQKRQYRATYNITANRPSEENNTKEDSTDPTTEAMPFTATPIEIDGEMIIQVAIEPNEKNQEKIDAWYTEVYTPDFSEAYVAASAGKPVAKVPTSTESK